ncbi:MAG TPA: 3-carboxy-cis,cis-muconate cycloisomerase [Candidatus Binataceae bacterium]|nr:3-carboxy-cis,cis-muconate cycloisomerase [Candidatus Binataceae bacterium]
MPSTAIDSIVLGDLFSTPAMREVFSDANRLRCYLEVEAALARVEARLGIIPAEAAAEIARHAIVAEMDFDRLRQRTLELGSTVMPVVEQLRARCAGGHGQYCHWGATTQDVTDSAAVLQIRSALVLVESDLRAIGDTLSDLARRYRDTPMAGRTKLQHATPITFGFKMAEALDAVRRHLARLEELRPRVLVGQFGGAAGTLAALGSDGLEVRAGLMRELGLREPEITWHSHRDRFAEVACFLGLVTGTLGKIATDIKLLMQTEVGEVFEPFESGRGSSSTMPQKRNPVACNYILACTAMVRQQAAAMLEAMVEDHERGTGPWEIEWVALPEIFLLSSGAMAHSRTMLARLRVDAAKMRENLDLTNGLILAEGVAMALAPMIGRGRAHELIAELCEAALERKRPLFELLAENREITAHLDRAALERLCDPAGYLGAATLMVDRVLSHRK